MTAKISIIVPVYNGEKTLRRCLDGLRAQTLKDIEIIAVDDASTDESAQILQHYRELDSRFRVLTHERNLHGAQARRTGTLAATGDYLMYVDSDDELTSNACSELYASMQENPVDILHFGCTVIPVSPIPQHVLADVKNTLAPYEGELTGEQVFTGCFIDRLYAWSLWNKIISTKVGKRAFQEASDHTGQRFDDAYCYFIISYYAQSYRSLPNHSYYNYYYGAGQSGHDSVSLPGFESNCDSSQTAKAILSFITRNNLSGYYITAYQVIVSNMVGDCVNLLLTSLPIEDAPAAYDILFIYWNARDLISEFAKRFWHSPEQVVRLLGTSNSLSTINTPRSIEEVAILTHDSTELRGGSPLSVWISNLTSNGYRITIILDGADPAHPARHTDQNIEVVSLPLLQTPTPEDISMNITALEHLIQTRRIDTIIYLSPADNCFLSHLMLFKSMKKPCLFVARDLLSTHFDFSIQNQVVSPSMYGLPDALLAWSKADAGFLYDYNQTVFLASNTGLSTEIPRFSCSIVCIDDGTDVPAGEVIDILSNIIRKVPTVHIFYNGPEATQQELCNFIIAEDLESSIESIDSIEIHNLPQLTAVDVVLVVHAEKLMPILMACLGEKPVCILYPFHPIPSPCANLLATDSAQVAIRAAIDTLTAALADERTTHRRRVVDIPRPTSRNERWTALMGLLQLTEMKITQQAALPVWEVSHTIQSFKYQQDQREKIHFDQRMQNLVAENDVLTAHGNELTSRIQDIEQSTTWKVGRVLTWLPRKVRDALSH